MSSHKNYKALTSRFQKPLILLVVMFVLTLMNPGIFLTLGNFKSILLAISIYGVMVCGTIYPILLGGIDLAVGATAAMSGACVVLTIVKMDYSFTGVILGILFGLAAGVMAGIAHGAIVSNFNVPPFLITLASQNIIYSDRKSGYQLSGTGCIYTSWRRKTVWYSFFGLYIGDCGVNQLLAA